MRKTCLGILVHRNVEQKAFCFGFALHLENCVRINHWNQDGNKIVRLIESDFFYY